LRIPVFALEEVEQLNQVALLGVGTALAVGVVVLAEVPVQHRGVEFGEVAIDVLRGHPGVESLGRAEIGVDGGGARPLF